MEKRIRIIAAILILALIFLSAASCDKTVIIDDNDIVRFYSDRNEIFEYYGIEPMEEPVLSPIDNSETEIGIMTQEYIGDNIAEILMIKYDGGQPELEQYNWKNPEIEMINLTIKSGIQQEYNDFMNDRANNPDWYDWIEIKSYPFTSDDYVQIVMTSVIYPTYGTDGDISSYNFSKKENRWITLDDAMDDYGLTNEIITQNVKELYEPEYEGTYIKEVVAKGFLLCYGTDPYTIFLLEITTDNPEAADEWKSFYAYEPSFFTRELDEFYQLNSYCLFDPYDMDQMDPPLSYGQPKINGDLAFGDLDY